MSIAAIIMGLISIAVSLPAIVFSARNYLRTCRALGRPEGSAVHRALALDWAWRVKARD